MTIFRWLVPLAAACLCCPPLCADEFRLADGRVLVGKAVDKGDTWEIATNDGIVIVAKTQVVAHRRENELREELAGRARAAGDTAFANLHLAASARELGLVPELWRHLDRAVRQQREATAPAHLQAAPRAPLQRRIDDFLAQLEPEVLPRKWRAADVRTRVHRLLEQLRADAGPGRTAAIEELLVREPNADQDLRLEARRNVSAQRRTVALGALLRREAAGNDSFVLRTTVLDGSPEVREAAAELLRGHGRADAAAVTYLAPGLMHQNGRMRVRTAEAFAALGHRDALRLLVLAGPNAGVALAAADPAVRGHVAFLNQQAYIRDFDVEVASASFIADPKVGLLQSGAVLDVTVAGVFEATVIVRAYRQALRRLAGSDPGADPRAWATWLGALAPQAPPATGGR
ncbi:MAG: hypothetical protein FJ265_16145 [Planctomycetes bacterium]|nr:hypothetical protein [Planctomycetota bacterium]